MAKIITSKIATMATRGKYVDIPKGQKQHKLLCFRIFKLLHFSVESSCSIQIIRHTLLYRFFESKNFLHNVIFILEFVTINNTFINKKLWRTE